MGDPASLSLPMMISNSQSVIHLASEWQMCAIRALISCSINSRLSSLLIFYGLVNLISFLQLQKS